MRRQIPGPSLPLWTIHGGPVRPLNVLWFYWVGIAMADLKRSLLPTDVRALHLRPVALALKEPLERLVENKTVGLSSSQEDAANLLSALSFLFPEPSAPDGVIGHSVRKMIENAADHFNNTLNVEVAKAHTFIVGPAHGYDMATLIKEGDGCFAAKTREAMPPKARKDFRQATKCIAFQLWTAAGFHLMRSVEVVVLRYFAIAGFPQPKARNWGVYIDTLKAGKVDDKLVSKLDELRKYDRNELMHPETWLTEETALELFHHVKSVMSALIRDLTKRGALPAPARATAAEAS